MKLIHDNVFDMRILFSKDKFIEMFVSVLLATTSSSSLPKTLPSLTNKWNWSLKFGSPEEFLGAFGKVVSPNVYYQNLSVS